ncbi:hypothetical protein M8542_00355 [Amycolatopsis sp. OK19-0408]|uniref:Uncharacterized protein n=1 Tax=Amycolatopsis iheyensis TaxID=2945988 RepID=A0A9X2NB99_9PSEU|nr:hypothetical protein [Amycolatopsis iheyensis]MCR6481260.1 hypothetical protein [Amycolatopsis iheyensis]
MVAMIVAGSKAHFDPAEDAVPIAIIAAVALIGLGVFLFVQNRRSKTRAAGNRRLAQQLDGRPLVYVPYADCRLSVPDVLSAAQAHGYALTPNPAALRYEFALGAPQTAFTGNPRAAYIGHMLDGRATYELRILFEPMTLPELMVVAHSRGYTVQPSRKVYQFMRHRGRP